VEGGAKGQEEEDGDEGEEGEEQGEWEKEVEEASPTLRPAGESDIAFSE
jgi:hypothetical protein